MDEVYPHALKLLRQRDYTVAGLHEKLATKFGGDHPEVIDRLIKKNFLNDRRFAENYVARRIDHGEVVLREELAVRGVAAPLIDEIIAGVQWPSLHEALAARMNALKLHPPLQ